MAALTPINFVATASSDRSVLLTFNPAVGGTEIGISIEISTSSGTGFVEIDTVDDDATSYEVLDLTPDLTYYFRLRSYEGGPVYSSYTSVKNATPSTQAGIAYEASIETTDGSPRPLPLLGHWNTLAPPTSQTSPVGWHPTYQQTQIEAGHFYLPWLEVPEPRYWSVLTTAWQDFAEDYLIYCRDNNLPLSFYMKEPESAFYLDGYAFKNYTEENNPCCYNQNTGIREDKVDFLGPTAAWTECGNMWSSTAVFAWMQTIYPNPPRVVFYSSNEAVKSGAYTANDNKRFVTLHGLSKTQQEKIDIVHDAFKDRYTAMWTAFKANLVPAWSNVTKIIGLTNLSSGFGNFLGRYSSSAWNWSWAAGSPSELNREHEKFNGISPMYVSWSFLCYQRTNSPQMHAQWWPLLLDYVHSKDAGFWFEFSTFQGFHGGTGTLGNIENTGMNANGFKGMNKLGAWLLQPRSIRHTLLGRSENINTSDHASYWNGLTEIVDEIHNTPKLREFWKSSTKVLNGVESIPALFANSGTGYLPPDGSFVAANNWWKLTTSVDLSYATDETLVPVWAMARVKGTTPNREWLVFAFATDSDRSGVTITVPGHGNIIVDVPEAGSYFLVQEGVGVVDFPVTPTGLDAAQISTTTDAAITWTPPASGADTVRIRWSWNQYVWTEITAQANDGSYTLDFVDYDGTTLYVQIAGDTDGGTSFWSSSATATISEPGGEEAPGTPTLTSATATREDSVLLVFAGVDANETGFSIEASLDGSTNWTEVGTSAADTTSYTVTGLSEDVLYYFRIRAYNSNVSPSLYSSYSTTKSATPSHEAEISYENTLSTTAAGNRPLPFLCHWNNQRPGVAANGTQLTAPGWSTAWQLPRIRDQKLKAIPWLALPEPRFHNALTTDWIQHAQPILEYARDNNLPITLVYGQPEQAFYEAGNWPINFLAIPEATSPTAWIEISPGVYQYKIDPIGPIEHWTNCGDMWTNTAIFAWMQTIYPAPPLVLMCSNNEATKINNYSWDQSYRLVDAHGASNSKTSQQKIDIIFDLFAERYQALWAGMRSNMLSGNIGGVTYTWADNAKFIGYTNFNSGMGYYMGRYSYALNYWDYSASGEIARTHEWLDGHSHQYYNYQYSAYNIANSSQMFAQWWPLMQNYIESINPDFWSGFSVMQGYHGGSAPGGIESAGMTPDGFAGMCMYGAWLLLPRELRHYMDTYRIITESDNQAYWDALVTMTHRIHSNSILRSFWKDSSLVVNTGETPPATFFNTGAAFLPPTGYVPADNWYKLTTSEDPASYTSSTTNYVPVWASARVKGTTPNRVWLVWAFATDQDRTNVQITIPGHGNITVNVPEEGDYFLVKEGTGLISFPVSPSNLAVAQIGTTKNATITWTAESTADTVSIRYSWDGFVWKTITGITDDGSYVLDFESYQDTTLYVQIASVNSAGQSEWSGTVGQVITASATISLSINVPRVTYYSSMIMFKDVFKHSSEWISQPTSGTDPWDDGRVISVDSDGWVTSLQSGQAAATLIMRDLNGHHPTGEYTVLWDGTGTLEFLYAATMTSYSANQATINVAASNSGILLRITSTSPGDPLRNIRVVKTSDLASYVTAPFRDEYLDFFSNFRALRFMNPMVPSENTVVNWADRVKTTAVSQANGTKGVAYEWIIQLANALQKDLWICVPHRVSNDFVTQMATLFKSQLLPGLRVFLEYCNEAWNTSFTTQYNYLRDQGLALGLSGDGYQASYLYYSQRSVEVFNLWNAVWAGETDRVIRVLAGQAVNSWITMKILTHNDAGNSCDAFAIAPYFSGGLGNSNAAQAVTWNLDQVFAYLTTDMTTIASTLITPHITEIYNNGYSHIELIAYEGGQHLVGSNGWENNETLTNLLIAANADPRMGVLYDQYFTVWKNAGGYDFFHYGGPAEVWSKWGSWGLLQYEDQEPNGKYTATVNWSTTYTLPSAAPGGGTPTPPSLDPTNLIVSSEDLSVILNFTDNTTGNHSHLVWHDRSSSFSSETLITTLSSGVVEYTDTNRGLARGAHYYRVQASGLTGDLTDYSNTGSVTFYLNTYASSKSSYLKDKILKHRLGVEEYTAPSNLYLALGTGELPSYEIPTGSPYQRKLVTFTGLGLEVTNISGITFPTGNINTIEISTVGIFDSVTGGNLLYTLGYDSYSPISGVSGQAITIPAQSLKIYDL